MSGKTDNIKLPALMEEVLSEGRLVKMIFSKKRMKSDPCSKVTMRPVAVKSGILYQAEYSFDKKVTHENLSLSDAVTKCVALSRDSFKQINIMTENEDIQVLANKPGDPRVIRSCASRNKADTSHDHRKNYIIPEGVPCDFLVHLGVMDDKGKVYKKHYSKFRQINRFLEIVDEAFPSLAGNKGPSADASFGPSSKNGDLSAPGHGSDEEHDFSGKPLKIIDFGCGKAYLTFGLYHYFVKLRKIPCRIIGLDLKEDVIRFCEKTARALDYEGLHFEIGDIADYSDDSADLVVTLHACDTATDYALINAVNWNTKVILSVPCCQHELFKQIDSPVNAPMLRHGIIKDKFTELLTDALRGLKLEACGYDVSMMEFTSLEHTSKNIMIKAVRSGTPDSPAAVRARSEYDALKKEYNVSPAIDALNI